MRWRVSYLSEHLVLLLLLALSEGRGLLILIVSKLVDHHLGGGTRSLVLKQLQIICQCLQVFVVHVIILMMIVTGGHQGNLKSIVAIILRLG